MKRRTLLKFAPIAGCLGSPVFAQSSNPVLTIIVPFSPGGLTDAMARAMQNSLATSLKRTVIVENKPGAAGLIAAQHLISRGGDGNSLLFVNHGFVIAPLLSSSAKYDAKKDARPVAVVAEGPSYFMINSSVPANNLSEFIAWAKQRPHGVLAANSGMGTAGHIQMMLFAKMAGITIQHVPYKGSAETANALVAGEVHMQITATTPGLNASAKAGKVKFLGTAGATRSKLAPEIPTIDSVVPGYITDAWYGLMANSATSDTKVEEYAVALKSAISSPETISYFNSLFMEAKYSGPTEFAAMVNKTLEIWPPILNDLDIKKS